MARTKSTQRKATNVPNKEDSSLPEDDSSDCESLFSRDEEEGVEEGEVKEGEVEEAEAEEEAEDEDEDFPPPPRPQEDAEYFEVFLDLQESEDRLEEQKKENRRLEMELCRRQEERYRVKTVIRDRIDVSLLLSLVLIS